MTARTNVMARKAEMHYTGLPIERRLTKDEDRCPFSLAVYQDATGYYMKSTNCTGPHQFHLRQDQLHASTSLLVEEEFQLQEDLNSARAKLGAAVNLYYICSACQGAPTVLLSSQIAYVCKKKSSDLNGKDQNPVMEKQTTFPSAWNNLETTMPLFLHAVHPWNQLPQQIQLVKQFFSMNHVLVTSLVKRMYCFLVLMIMICSRL
jgi:hypothetical protein